MSMEHLKLKSTAKCCRISLLYSNPIWLGVLLCVLVFTLFLFVVVLLEYRSQNEISLARESLAKKDTEQTLRHYSRSMAWYLPWGTAETAAEELLALAKEWDAKGEAWHAELALHRMRAGLYGARSFYIPRKDLIDQADPILARLMAKRKLGPNAADTEIAKQTEAMLKILQEPPRPNVVPAAAASFGFLGWIAAVFFFIWARFGEHPNVRRQWIWSGIWALCFIIWLWGLKYA